MPPIFARLTADLARPAAAEPRPGLVERRRTGRVARTEGLRAGITSTALIDVSPFGCCLRHVDPGIGPGHFVALRFATVGTVSGYVRWREGANIGIEFCRALAPDAERRLAGDEMLESVRRL